MAIKENCFIAPTASVVGEVTLGENVNIWFNAVVRGDDNKITIGNDTNIQDGCVLHVDLDYPLTIGNRVTVGHMALLHGCTVADQTLIGMNAVILNGAKIGKHCIIGAKALVTQNKVIPDNSLVLGAPAKIVRQVTKQEIEHIRWSAQHYVKRMRDYVTLPLD